MASTTSSYEEAARLRGLLRVASIMFLVGRMSCDTGILGRMSCGTGDYGVGIGVSEGMGRWNWINGVVVEAHANQIPAGFGSSDVLFCGIS
jgi:hypothetical protein